MHQEIKATVIWLLLAFFLTFAGFWQAKVVVARDFQPQHRQLPPPAKTKLAIRPPPEVFTGDVVADYIARCEKGMTDKEIRWILEDFRNAGLDLDWRNPAVTIEEVLHRRVAQHRWYHDALVDGLRLSPEQSTQVTQTLDALFEKEKHRFLEQKNSRPEPSPGASYTMTNPSYRDARELIADLSIPMTLFTDIPVTSPYFPWNLCELTSAQEKVTWKPWFLAFENKKLQISNREVAELSGGPLFHFLEPRGYRVDDALPKFNDLVDVICPLLALQKLVANEDPFSDPFSDSSDSPGLSALENVRLLHPCQLKAILLFTPEFSSILESQLDSEPH